MIVNPMSQGWEIIFQRAHALLAAKLAYYLQDSFHPEKTSWLEMLTSIAEHDDGQPDWQGKNHLTEAGAPRDITEQKYNLEQAKRVVSESAHKSRWVALMASMHTYYLHRPFKGDNQDMDDFLKEQQAYQNVLRKTLNVSQKESETAYTVMRWCDECSLILCKKQIPPQGKTLEVGGLPHDTIRYIYQPKDAVHISPWPFREDNFTLSVEVFCIKQLEFAHDQELQQLLKETEPELLQWQFEKD